VVKKSTIAANEEAARRARKKAAEQNTSVSKLVGRMLENQMRLSHEYGRAYGQWKRIAAIEVDATLRLSREEAHARG
jgi:hypothetical protein